MQNHQQYPVKATLINLSENQVAYLRTIKAEHGLSMSSYIRTLLKQDMERSLTGYSITEEHHEIRRTSRETIHRRTINPQWIALKSEMEPILAKRRAHADLYTS